MSSETYNSFLCVRNVASDRIRYTDNTYMLSNRR